MFNLVWWYAVWRKLTNASLHLTEHRAMALRYLPGPLLYLIATLFALVSAWISLIMYCALALFYALSNMNIARPATVGSNNNELASE